MNRLSSKIGVIAWVVVISVVVLLPYVGVERYTLQILTLAGIYAIVALGMNLLLGNAGQISLGQAAFFGIGAYTTAQLMVKYHLSFWLVMPLGGLLAGLVGFLLGYLALRFEGHYLAMVTLCFGLILQVLYLEIPALTGGAAGITNIPEAVFLGRPIRNADGAILMTFHVVWLLLALFFWLIKNFIELRSGRALAALKGDPVAAKAVGIPIAYYKIQAFTFSAVLAGFAGGLYSIHTRYIGPELFGVHSSLEFLIMVVIGGLGSPMGAIVGALLMAFLPEFMRQYEEYRLLFFGFILMIIVLTAPGGIWGLIVSRSRHFYYIICRRKVKTI